MSFAAPLLLAGLLLAGLPILIHLFNRRRAVRVRLPTVELLRRSQKKLARGLRLKQLLLLALRVAIFVLLPLALARPFRSAGNDAVADARLPTATVIIVDDSASMTAPGQRGATRFEDAVLAATERIEALRAWDQVAVVFAGGGDARTGAALSDQHRAAIERLEAREPGGARSELGEGFAVARALFATSRLPARRTVVFSDHAAEAWASVGAPDVAGLGELVLIDVGDESPRNVSVEGVRAASAPEGGVGTWQIEADIRCAGACDEADVPVSLVVDGTEVATTLVRPGQSVATAVFTHTLGEVEGAVPIEVRVRDGQGAAADDSGWALVSRDAAARVLLVNGDARSVQFNDELYFAERALEAPSPERRPRVLSTVERPAVGRAELDGVDVVVLANVGALDAPDVGRLVEFVEGGGGVLFTVGDRVDPMPFNAAFAPLLPRPLRDLRQLARPGDPDLGLRATRLGAVDAMHPIFRVFSAPGGETLQSGVVWEYALVESRAVADERVLASFADGAPALVERRIGSGSALLWLSSIDLAWTDLPLRTAYLPLLHRIVDHLARRGAPSAAAEVGVAHTLDVSVYGAERVAITPPAGERVTLGVDPGATSVTYVPTSLGVHTVDVGGASTLAPASELTFVAVSPAAERDPARVDESELDALRDASTAGVAQAETAREQGRSLWPPLLFALLVVFYLETAVGARRRVWRRIAGVGRPRTSG